MNWAASGWFSLVCLCRRTQVLNGARASSIWFQRPRKYWKKQVSKYPRESMVVFIFRAHSMIPLKLRTFRKKCNFRCGSLDSADREETLIYLAKVWPCQTTWLFQNDVNIWSKYLIIDETLKCDSIEVRAALAWGLFTPVPYSCHRLIGVKGGLLSVFVLTILD